MTFPPQTATARSPQTGPETRQPMIQSNHSPPPVGVAGHAAGYDGSDFWSPTSPAAQRPPDPVTRSITTV